MVVESRVADEVAGIMDSRVVREAELGWCVAVSAVEATATVAPHSGPAQDEVRVRSDC